MAKLLLISNSTNAGEPYLQYPMPNIEAFLKSSNVKSALFIPYAGVTITWDEYTRKVRERFEAIGVKLTSIHECADPVKAVEEAESIVVGGGNTFNLLKTMQENKLVEPIKAKALEQETPYIGWSAGSGVAAPTLCTTNDMPIVEPLSFTSLNLVGFQINPHYTEAHPPGFAGETRMMRLAEYVQANQSTTVVGLQEGCMLHVEGGKVNLIGAEPVKIFKFGVEPYEVKGEISEHI